MVKLSGGEKFSIYFGAEPELFRLAGELRHSMTPAEIKLWQHLRNRKLLGFKFRRQHPLNIFIVDFYCHEARLVIELDGQIHDDQTQKERDIERAIILKRFGITELRFTNHEIQYHLTMVLNKITEHIKILQLPSPKRGKGQG